MKFKPGDLIRHSTEEKTWLWKVVGYNDKAMIQEIVSAPKHRQHAWPKGKTTTSNSDDYYYLVKRRPTVSHLPEWL